MKDVAFTFEQFLLESKVTVKRKYTDKHPEKNVSSRAPIREKILSFVKENKEVTYEAMMEFLKSVNEETGGNTTRKWLNKNEKYFKITEKNGVKTYKLSSYGERVHAKIQELNN
jgi:hypothetical protein